ncbi:unnamed protein product, partial [Effrenium voratum]
TVGKVVGNRLRWPKLIKPEARAAPQAKPRAEKVARRALRPSVSTRESLAHAVASRKAALQKLARRPEKSGEPEQRFEPPARPERPEPAPREAEAELVVGGTAFTVRRFEGEAPPSLHSMLAFLDAEAEFHPEGRQNIPLTRGSAPNLEAEASAAPKTLELKAPQVPCPAGPVSTWTVDQVCQFLDHLGLGHTQEKFKESAVDGQLLLGLSEEELCEELSLRKLQAKKLLSRLPTDSA